MLSIDLSGKISLVTGASGELGRVMVRTLARAGAEVVVHYHKNTTQAAALVQELQQMGRRALAVQADITKADEIKHMCALVVEKLGAPDIIVNNAVIQYQWTDVLEQSPADYEGQFRSCVMQNVLMAQAFVPQMIEKKWGRVIAISTECAMQNFPHQSAYVSGKRGMDGVLRVLAKEIGQYNITVNQVAPGWTISENRTDSDAAIHYRDQVPLHRRGTDQEIANVVAFLASDLASYITGAYIPVCGGNVMPTI
jgi:3-oxoacyl-[acyl-carrier protein] reductase